MRESVCLRFIKPRHVLALLQLESNDPTSYPGTAREYSNSGCARHNTLVTQMFVVNIRRHIDFNLGTQCVIIIARSIVSKLQPSDMSHGVSILNSKLLCTTSGRLYSIQSSAVITRSNITLYFTLKEHCRNWNRISTRVWTHKRHGRAMGCISLIFSLIDRVITAS